MSLITYNTNTSNILALKDYVDDIFINYMTHLYELNELDLLTNFHETTNTFYNNLILLLMEYNNNLNSNDNTSNDNTKINMILNNLKLLTENYYDSFKLNLGLFYNIQFKNYFENKQKNINDLDIYQNNGYIISNLQIEWYLRITNINKYYNWIYSQIIENTENTETNTITSYINKSIDYIFNKTNKVITNALIKF